MNTLRANLDKVEQLKSVLTSGQGEYYSVDEVNYDKYPVTTQTISIIMTTHNRSRQLYFTLDTITKSRDHSKVQLILVDDSSEDKVMLDKLATYPFAVTFIQINRDKKFWYNPCVNYNIGFQHIKGTKIIIQNGEVCHIGDVLATLDHIQDNHYYAYDVKALKDFQANEQIYDSLKKSPTELGMLDITIYDNPGIYTQWYQHIQYRNAYYHFLTACTRSTFDKVSTFSLDYAFGNSYDDDDFVLKIKYAGIKLCNMQHDQYKCGGVHLYHGHSNNGIAPEINGNLFQKKTHYVARTNRYIEISACSTIHDINAKFNELNCY